MLTEDIRQKQIIRYRKIQSDSYSINSYMKENVRWQLLVKSIIICIHWRLMKNFFSEKLLKNDLLFIIFHLYLVTGQDKKNNNHCSFKCFSNKNKNKSQSRCCLKKSGMKVTNQRIVLTKYEENSQIFYIIKRMLSLFRDLSSKFFSTC